LKIKLAQADLKRTELGKEWQQHYQYRPFDVRYTYYTGQPRGFHCNPRWPVMKHLIAGPNLAFCCAKSVETGHEFAHTFVTRAVADHHSVSLKEVNYVFPALTYSGPGDSHAEPQRGLFSEQGVRAESNLSGEIQRRLFANLGLTVSEHGAGLRSVEVVAYMYAVLHSPSYRSRYASFLRKGFARIPVGGNQDLFDILRRLGGELIALHLLESSTLRQSVTGYSGPGNPEVGRIGWSNNTVWLNVEAVKKGQRAGVGTIGFNGVSEAVWNFHVGGYQVCEKWLKDRKERKLLKTDIEHYQRIVVAISETIRIMKEIDEVIDRNGGWPRAFQT
jgi:predicted helicase